MTSKTTQTELEKRLKELEADRLRRIAQMKANTDYEPYHRYAERHFDYDNGANYRQLALSAIKLAAARGELIEWLESGATSGDAEIRRRIEEASK